MTTCKSLEIVAPSPLCAFALSAFLHGYRRTGHGGCTSRGMAGTGAAFTPLQLYKPSARRKFERFSVAKAEAG
jgi:hypothetical protein